MKHKFYSRSIVLIVLALLVVAEGIVAIVSYRSVDQELTRQAASMEIALDHGVFLLAEGLNDPECNLEYIAGLAVSFQNFAAVNSDHGIYQKIGEAVSRFTRSGDDVQITEDVRAQAAAILMELTDTSEVTEQLELLRQLNSLLQ